MTENNNAIQLLATQLLETRGSLEIASNRETTLLRDLKRVREDIKTFGSAIEDYEAAIKALRSLEDEEGPNSDG